MCTCRTDIESRLLDHVKGQLPPNAENVRVSLEGYALMLGEQLEMKNCMPIRIDYRAKTKAGALKDKKSSMTMTGNYCMFCGERYKKVGEDMEATA